MKVVLLQPVQGLGEPGTVREVKNGYANNFLLPRKLAVPATPGALKQVEQQQAAVLRKQEKIDAQAAGLAARIQGQELVFRARTGEEGRLFGSVTNSDIADILGRQIGEDIDRRRVILEDPIHVVGEYDVPVRLSAAHSPTVKVIVQPES